jgi:hypothetical protein
MDSKRSNNTNPDNENNRSTNSIGQGKAYIPFERKESSKRVGKYITGALLVLMLGGLSTFGYKKFLNHEGSEISKVNFSQSKLIKSILAISDEDEKLTDKERLSKKAEAKKEIETHIAQDSRKDPQSSMGLFKGILTKCYITGHDVHWINENAENGLLFRSKTQFGLGLSFRSDQRMQITKYELLRNSLYPTVV